MPAGQSSRSGLIPVVNPNPPTARTGAVSPFVWLLEFWWIMNQSATFKMPLFRVMLQPTDTYTAPQAGLIVTTLVHILRNTTMIQALVFRFKDISLCCKSAQNPWKESRVTDLPPVGRPARPAAASLAPLCSACTCLPRWPSRSEIRRWGPPWPLGAWETSGVLKQWEVNSAGAKIREVQGHFFFFLITRWLILALSHPGALALQVESGVAAAGWKPERLPRNSTSKTRQKNCCFQTTTIPTTQ